jgi:hypothetical protein
MERDPRIDPAKGDVFEIPRERLRYWGVINLHHWLTTARGANRYVHRDNWPVWAKTATVVKRADPA